MHEHDEIARQLAKLIPSGQMDRDDLLFRAGQAAGLAAGKRSARPWQALCAVFASAILIAYSPLFLPPNQRSFDPNNDLAQKSPSNQLKDEKPTLTSEIPVDKSQISAPQMAKIFPANSLAREINNSYFADLQMALRFGADQLPVTRDSSGPSQAYRQHRTLTAAAKSLAMLDQF